MALSPDGSHAYFVAQGVLSATANEYGQLPQAGGDNLYVYQRDGAFPDGHLAFIATLPGRPSTDDNNWNTGGRANVTSDGRFLVFTSHADLTPDDSRAALTRPRCSATTRRPRS